MSHMELIALLDLFCSSSPLKIDFYSLGLEVGLIRPIQVLDTAYWGFIRIKILLKVTAVKIKTAHDIDADEDITLENVHDEDIFDTELKSARPKTKGVVMQEPSETTTITTTIPSKDKGKGRENCKRKEEDNAALIAQWINIQDKVETNYELAQLLQAEEQEELTSEEKYKLFQQLLEKRRKHFAAKKAE
ncbi:hypothetical protein Tco_1388439 [Tanacetum coccineum]